MPDFQVSVSHEVITFHGGIMSAAKINGHAVKSVSRHFVEAIIVCDPEDKDIYLQAYNKDVIEAARMNPHWTLECATVNFLQARAIDNPKLTTAAHDAWLHCFKALTVADYETAAGFFMKVVNKMPGMRPLKSYARETLLNYGPGSSSPG